MEMGYMTSSPTTKTQLPLTSLIVFLTSQEGYARVGVTHLIMKYATSELDLNGDYLPAGDWDGDGLDDLCLHRLDRDSVEAFASRWFVNGATVPSH